MNISAQVTDEASGLDPVSVSVNLIDPDNQFTLADKASLEITVTVNKKLGTAYNLEIRLDKKAITADSLGLERNYLFRETPAFLIQKSEKDVYEHDSYGDKPVEGGFEQIAFNIYGIQKGESRTFYLDLLSDSEINTWIYRNLIANPTKKDESHIKAKSKKDISQILDVELWDYYKNKKLFSLKPKIKMNGKSAEIKYPYFNSAQSLFDKDPQRKNYYLFGDYYWHNNTSSVRFLAIRAARYNRNSKNETRFLTQNLMPETEKQVVDQIAKYLFDLLQPKTYPEVIKAPQDLADWILDGRVDFGKPLSSFKTGFQLLNAARNLIPEGPELARRGFACIEHAYLFNNLTRILGFPTRGINTMVGPAIWVNNLIGSGGSQDASSEVFYSDDAFSQHSWHYYSLFNYSDDIITSKELRYSGDIFSFQQWSGIKAMPEDTLWDIRYNMSVEKMNNSEYWEKSFGQFGKSGQAVILLGKGIKGFGGAIVNFIVHSPVDINLKLLDGTVVGGNGTRKVDSSLANEYLFFDLSPENRAYFNPKPGVYYLPEGLPVMSLDDELVKHGTYQTLTVAESLVGDISKIKLNIIGTDNGKYTITTTKVTSDKIIYYEPIISEIKKGEHTTLGGSNLKVDYTFDIPKDTLFIGSPIIVTRSEAQQPVTLEIRRWNNIDEEESLYLKVESLPSFVTGLNWKDSQTVKFDVGENKKSVSALINVKTEGGKEEGKLIITALPTKPQLEKQPQIIIPVQVARKSETAAEGKQEGRLVALPLRADAPEDFPREDAVDFVAPEHKELTVYDRIALFYTPSRPLADGFMWQVFSPAGAETSVYGFELDQKPRTYGPAKAGSPGKFVAIVTVVKPGVYSLKTCPVTFPAGLFGSWRGEPVPDTEKYETEGTFEVAAPVLHFKDFILEPFKNNSLPEGEYLGDSHVTLERTGTGRQVKLSVRANWERRISSNRTIKKTTHETYAAGDFTFPETLDPSKSEMGSGAFTVEQPDEVAWLDQHAKGPYEAAGHNVLTVKFHVGELYAIDRVPPERDMFAGPKAAKPFGVMLGKGMPPEKTFRELSRGWGQIGEKQIVFDREFFDRKFRNTPFGIPEQPLSAHLRSAGTVFVVPVRVELYENTRGLGDGPVFVRRQVWGYAVYEVKPGKYAGPMPTGHDTLADTGSRPDKIKPPEKDPSGNRKEPEKPQKNIDPKDPKIGGLIKEWIQNAKPLANAKGADLRFDKWGRVEGRAVGGIITLTGSPDDVAGRSPEKYVWDNRGRMDSINLCKLEEYVVAQIKGEDISYCRDRKKEVIKSIVPEITGRTAQEAKAITEKAGLIPELEVGEETLDPKKEGIVYKQIPSPSTELEPGSRVTLLVHTLAGNLPVVPDVIGIDAGAAFEAVTKAGLKPELEVGEQTRDRKKENITYYQTPAPGSTVEAGSNVVIKLYSFAEVTLKVPLLTGLPLLDAKRDIEKTGLKISVNLEGPAPKKSVEGRVSKQKPEPGSNIKEGAVVEVWVYGEYVEVVQPVKPKEIHEKTTTEYCALGKANFPYQPDREYYVFRGREPRKYTSGHNSREYKFLPDNARNVQAAVRQIQQEGKMELVFTGKLPGLCPHLRENCAYSTLNHADGSFFGDICGKWEDPPPVYVNKKPAAIPDLRGMAVTKARDTVQGLGMKISVELGAAASKQNDVNIVYKQSPGPGIDAAKGGGVTVWIYGDLIQAATLPNDASDTTGVVPFIDIPDIPSFNQITVGIVETSLNNRGYYSTKTWDVQPGRLYRPPEEFLDKQYRVRKLFLTYRKARGNMFSIWIAWREPSDSGEQNWTRFCRSDYHKEMPAFYPGGLGKIASVYDGSTTDGIIPLRIHNISMKKQVSVNLQFTASSEDSIAQYTQMNAQKEMLIKIVTELMDQIEPYAKNCE